MLTIDPRAAGKVQPQLLSGETIQWAAMPNPNKIFHSDDWSTIPFSLFWGGFTVFWEMGALGHWGNATDRSDPNTFMVLWGIPFIVLGNT